MIYRVGGVVLSKELLFSYERNQLLIRYKLIDAHSKTTLRLKPFLAFRHTKERLTRMIGSPVYDLKKMVSHFLSIPIRPASICNCLNQTSLGTKSQCGTSNSTTIRRLSVGMLIQSDFTCTWLLRI